MQDNIILMSKILVWLLTDGWGLAKFPSEGLLTPNSCDISFKMASVHLDLSSGLE